VVFTFPEVMTKYLNDIVNGFIKPDELPPNKAKASYKKEDLRKWIKF